jgi:hypothetical protein
MSGLFRIAIHCQKKNRKVSKKPVGFSLKEPSLQVERNQQAYVRG